jgi:uncharacterized protein (DUF433 family)
MAGNGNTLQEVQRLLPELLVGEKAQLLLWVVRDLEGAFPGIDQQPGVCGGSARVVRTRIPIWLLEQARRLGTTEAELLQAYPNLRAEDLANAWAYARAHSEEMDREIAENEEA